MRPLYLRRLGGDDVVKEAHKDGFLRRGRVRDAMSKEDAAQLGHRDLVGVDVWFEVPVLSARVCHYCLDKVCGRMETAELVVKDGQR